MDLWIWTRAFLLAVSQRRSTSPERSSSPGANGYGAPASTGRRAVFSRAFNAER
jgi:hypothetical protein